MSDVYLSTLLKQAVCDDSGHELGTLSDVVVALPTRGYPRVHGLVATQAGREVFLPAAAVTSLNEGRVTVTGPDADTRPFERRDGEVLLHADVLGHRLLDPDHARLVRAYDVVLGDDQDGWIVTGVDLHRATLWQRLTDNTPHRVRDWDELMALIGHQASAGHRGLARLGRLKPPQIADLLETASTGEQGEILHHVHQDPELEADVFEELDQDRQARLLASRSDADIAAVLGRMNADDAADAVMDLPQERRLTVLDALPDPQRQHVSTLLSYAEQTAGGLMTIDALTLPLDATAADALDALRAADQHEPQTLTGLYLLDPGRRLCGFLTLVAAVQAAPSTTLRSIADTDPVRVLPGDDLIHLTRLMADYNLLLLPVVDTDNRLLGVVTVDDALEAAIPDNWRHRHSDTTTAARTDDQPAAISAIDEEEARS